MAALTQYSVPEDMLLGDIAVPATMDRSPYINDAFKEMNARLGLIYKLPLDDTELSERDIEQLERISNLLASGRFVMAQAAGQEAAELHAYGRDLVREGREELGLILNGAIELDAPRLPTGEGPQGPSIANHDKTSAVDTFYDEFMGGHVPEPVRSGPVWTPGGG